MLTNDKIFNKIAKALLVDYSSVYYVNVVTNEYQWYSNDPEYHSLQLQPKGEDFFSDLVRDVELYIYDEDKHIFNEKMKKERLLSQMKKGTLQDIEYRLMIDGKPVYHSLRLIHAESSEEDDDYFIFGVLNVDKEVRERIAAEKVQQEREAFNQIATSLANHYDSIYYIDMITDEYHEFSSTDAYKALALPKMGNDFFSDTEMNLRKYGYPDDLELALNIYNKATMTQNIDKFGAFTSKYRLLVNNTIVNVRSTQIWASDRRHAIVCLENINTEVLAERELIESRQKSATFAAIAESLASKYDVIYYVDVSTARYTEFNSSNMLDGLALREDGRDFFADAARNAGQLLHPKDKERVLNALTKDSIISALESRKQYSIDYRLIINSKPQFTRLTIMWSGDKVHFIIGVQNIDDEVRKENEQLKALNHANELARRDELTGTKNTNAYHELEESVQQRIDSGCDYMPFAIVLCDINDLKIVNDTAGHKAGDEYICSASRLICNVFAHSPVFRIGGDEFAVFLSGNDYHEREALFRRLRDQVHENLKRRDAPVLATGIAVYDSVSDNKVSDVFKRADIMMYEEKTRLKSGYYNVVEDKKVMPFETKRQLDSLFGAFELVAEGAYVFVCNMQYDYSRWSKACVEQFELPSEYMYGAGDIWESHIHEDDRNAYHTGISDIFSGSASGHDMQYRAKRASGTFDLCTCRGIVLRDKSGKPEWFAGVIRNHGIHGKVDALTGLRNQYGFFEDLQSNMIKHADMRVCMIVINKFSEINEVYGYQFGNAILQKVARHLFDHIGSSGNAYRLDGTKFAVLTKSLSADEMNEKYEEMRLFFRKGFSMDDRFVILDLAAGLLNVDNYDIDYQTVYACLNFAYSESKLRRQGEMVEFYNDLNNNNRQRLEKLYAIRASIMQSYRGFYLLYQPVVDASTEKLIGAEALLRWKSEEYGMVPPDHFIPILEKDPLFCELGQWILRTAINGAKLIMEEHPDFVINVNLSYTQLEKPDFVEMVLRTLKEEGFPPDHLCMEITERCRLLDMYLLKNVIVNLRGHGIQIALDDFGTGFSSIGLVKNLPFDTIKIDRSFVLRIEDDPKERDLIRAFAGVASTFGAKVCVEGIETEGMRDILQQYRIQSFQGYYYGKPLELRDFLVWKPVKALPGDIAP